ncbi:MAG: 50S ribosomal protein L19 [Elusimicrobiota bacterium]
MANITDKYIKKDIPDFKSGDDVRVEMTVGKDKKRVQAFEGLVIARNGSGINKTFTVRKYSFGIGVEKIYPLFSPLITGITVLKKGKVRRSKLYYMRERYGKKARIKEIRQY